MYVINNVTLKSIRLQAKSDSSQKLTDAKSYADGVGSTTLSSANETAKGYADTAEKNANTNTANQLKSYSKTTEIESKIEQSANAIKQTVSETYVSNTTYETDINSLQGQIDGNIQTWSGTDVPTLKNEPASTWSDEEKATHIGDIYYDDNNHAYRFRVDSGVYSWQILTDTDVTKALSDSADAISKANATEKKLTTDYKTWSDTSSEIEQTKNGILQTVKDTYAESATVTDLRNDLKTNYSTTKDMNSAIAEKADSITLAVSETYSTKKTVEENLATSKSYADSVGSKTLESAKSDATSKANQAKSDAIADMDKKLTSYSTTEQMNSAIKTSADNITSTVSKTYSTKEEVANIQVGGRNLYKGTRDFSGNWVNKHGWTEDGTYDGLTVCKKSSPWGVLCQKINVNQSDVYTCSLYVKTDTLNNFQMYPNLGGTGLKYNILSKDTSVTEINTWKRIWMTIEVTEDGVMQFGVEPNNIGGNVWICGLKLEKGNKATDWTPAPEDDASFYDNVIYDTSGYGNNGSVTDSTCPTWSSDTPRYKGSYVFNGNNQYLKFQNPITSSSTDFTISCWVKFDDTTGNSTICTMRTAVGNGIALFKIGNKIRFDDNAQFTFSDYTISANAWTHVVVTRLSSCKKLYVK